MTAVLRLHNLPSHPPPILLHGRATPSHRSGAACSSSGRSLRSPLLAATLSRSSSSPSDAGLIFRRKLLYLERTLGIDPFDALARNPNLRSAPLSSVRAVVSLLDAMGLRASPSAAGRVLAMHPQLLTCDPSADLLPIFRFLLGPAAIPPADVPVAIHRCPRLLVSSVDDRLLPALYFLRRLGFVGSHRITCRTTLLLVSSVEGTLIPKIDYIQSLGFSRRDTIKMVLRSPGLLTFSIEKNFRPKVAFLMEEMGRDLVELKAFPHYFSFSLERRIKPRYSLLLEHGFDGMPLADMLRVSDGEFGDRLVEMKLRLLRGAAGSGGRRRS